MTAFHPWVTFDARCNLYNCLFFAGSGRISGLPRGGEPVALMSKPIKFSVAALVRRPGEPGFLAVRRPPDDDRLPDVWGLPAVSLAEGELPEAAVRRIGVEKLAAAVEPRRSLGVKVADRGTYTLVLMDVEADLVSGEPDVAEATSSATRYVDQCWTDDLGILRQAAAKGSLCAQIVLDRAGIGYGAP